MTKEGRGNEFLFLLVAFLLLLLKANEKKIFEWSISNMVRLNGQTFDYLLIHNNCA